MICMALCEVIKSPQIRKSGPIWVSPDENYVVTRYFFVYDSLTGMPWGLDTGQAEFKAEIKQSLMVSGIACE
eukprot:NODE_2709_length_753_cov_153.455966_g1900_i0.p3 GENE.NODE_2709_length_753_cov_153.455966_g1900_i0~~NODE_2709_length_753_cov_153.455966_g1900_i0.p3  ORF type:complete len:72 (+),score=22.97 NODE_2709_length_753_cov_153.455966_g1900_i0:80-295(+)